MSKRSRVQSCTPLTILLALLSAGAFAQVPLRDDHSGPYNVTILEGGEGLTRKLEPGTASLEANGAWSMTGWVNPRRIQHGTRGPARRRQIAARMARALFLADGKPALYVDKQVLASDSAIASGSWTAIAATYDGTTRTPLREWSRSSVESRAGRRRRRRDPGSARWCRMCRARRTSAASSPISNFTSRH